MQRIFFIVFVFLSSGASALAESATTRKQYIENWKDEAIYQMVTNKIPASITLAQGILESGDGNSRLAREGNNHFGIKCHTDWKGKKIIEDDETKGECFRKYNNARESYEDHSLFLSRTRYESLFKLEIDNYKGWAKGLKECGYATNPKYPDLLIKIIEEFELAQYDKLGKDCIKQNKIPKRTTGETDVTPILESKKKSREKVKSNSRSKDDRNTININSSREIKRSERNIKYVVVQKSETIKSIADELGMNPWQIIRYNDLSENGALQEGQMIYTQPKRNKGSQDNYIVKKGDTLWSISQEEGLKLKKLKTYNSLVDAQEIKVGQQLKLRK